MPKETFTFLFESRAAGTIDDQGGLFVDISRFELYRILFGIQHRDRVYPLTDCPFQKKRSMPRSILALTLRFLIDVQEKITFLLTSCADRATYLTTLVYLLSLSMMSLLLTGAVMCFLPQYLFFWMTAIGLQSLFTTALYELTIGPNRVSEILDRIIMRNHHFVEGMMTGSTPCYLYLCSLLLLYGSLIHCPPVVLWVGPVVVFVPFFSGFFSHLLDIAGSLWMLESFDRLAINLATDRNSNEFARSVVRQISQHRLRCSGGAGVYGEMCDDYAVNVSLINHHHNRGRRHLRAVPRGCFGSCP